MPLRRKRFLSESIKENTLLLPAAVATVVVDSFQCSVRIKIFEKHTYLDALRTLELEVKKSVF